ncbi:MAG: proline--tRNA ligase [Oscillospiraceae bacterium]|nr:proline--tRNA ligase [Oscillospiraceae bacterium]
MKINNSYFYTIREDAKEEESKSGNLLVRSGMIRKNSAGIYMYLPLGFKVLKNIENIIRKHMNKADSTEVLMPALVAEDYYVRSGRKEAFGNSVFTLKDRFDKPYVLGPTHEELFLIAASYGAQSHKDLPFNLYQFQNKFRDEARPRFGLIRVREFIMKDAYSFDKDLDGLDVSYQKMFDAYKNCFDEMGIDYKIITADTGMMGGILSEEFQAIADIGEDTLVLCDNCDYATNVEITPLTNEQEEDKDSKLEYEEVYTPNCKTIEDVGEFLKQDMHKLVKALMFNADGKLCICFVPGEREVNITKLGKILGAKEIELATEEEILENSNSVPGFTGPIGLDVKEGVKIVVDENILKLRNFVVGANKKDYHYINANIDNFKYDYKADICLVKEGDNCPDCNGKLHFKKGIEIGNTFKLGAKYAESYDVKYLDQNNELKPIVMGSYGIGPGRCMVSIIEQNSDDKGIIWPYSIAPFKVAIVVIDTKNEKQMDLGTKLYEDFEKANIDVILDDRNERAGVKFNDMELIGIPVRITVGRKAEENIVELKYRNESEVTEINEKDAIQIIEDKYCDSKL